MPFINFDTLWNVRFDTREKGEGGGGEVIYYMASLRYA